MSFRIAILALLGAISFALLVIGADKPNIAVEKSNPLIVSHGGIYQGDWSSDDPAVPVIKIETREPVVIEKSSLRGRGALIVANGGGANLTIRETSGVGLNPNVPDRAAGRFVEADEIAHLTIEHCQLDGTAGIYIHRIAKEGPNPNTSIRIVSNLARNIDGRRSDGHGGYRGFNIRTRLTDGHVEEGFDVVQFVQLDGVTGLPAGEIAWNQVVNEPGNSRVEDNISIYESSGTELSPLLIHDNCIVGAYPVDPTKVDAVVDGWREDWSYSGGGIMVGDGPATSLATASGYVRAYANLVAATTNYGIAVSSGHDMSITDNHVLASGMLPDGKRIHGQNVGVYIWDTGKGRLRTPPTFFKNDGSANVIGWAGPTPQSRNDWWIPSTDTWHDNRHWPGEVTPDIERHEIEAWKSRAAAAGMSPGLPSHR